MRILTKIALFLTLLFVLSLGTAHAQIDFPSQLPIIGTTAPATCTAGRLFFDTDATAGRNLYGCTAANTWTLLGDGAAGMGSGCATAGSAGQVLADDGMGGCLSTTPTISGSTITATLSGNATTATTATLASTITVIDSTDSTSFIAMFDSATGSLAIKTDGGLLYNASNATLTATTFVGALTGNSTTATALAANPADCAADTYAIAIAASGALTCGLVNLEGGVIGDIQVANINGGANASSNTFHRGDNVWATVTADPAGNDTEVQINIMGATGADSGLTFDITTDILTAAGGFSSAGPASGAIFLEGITSGGAALVVNDIAGTAVSYILPTSSSQGLIWFDNGTATCPTLAASMPSTCHQITNDSDFGYGGDILFTPKLHLSAEQIISNTDNIQFCVDEYACTGYVEVTAHVSVGGMCADYCQTLLSVQSTEDAMNGYYDSDIIFKTDTGSKFSMGVEFDGTSNSNPRFYIFDQVQNAGAGMGIVHLDSAASPTWVFDAGVNVLVSASLQVDTSFLIPRGAGLTCGTDGQICFDTTADMLHASQTGADAMVPQFTITPSNNECVKWVVSGSNYKLGSAGAACGSGGSSVEYLDILSGSGLTPDASGNVTVQPYGIVATNDFWNYNIFQFANTSTLDCAYTRFVAPKTPATSVTFTMVWSSTVTTGDVVWNLYYRVITGNDAASLDQATAQRSLTVTDTAPSATDERMVANMSGTIGDFTAGDTVQVKFCRDGTASDTLAGIVQLHQILTVFD